MSFVLILLSLVGLCLGISGWLWLCAGFRRGGWRGAAGIAALQVSGLCLAYGVMRGQPMWGLFMAAFPPLAVVQVLALKEYLPLVMLLARTVAPWAGAVLVVALALRPVRVWAPGLALLTALVGAVVLGGGPVQQAMCRAGAARGVTEFSWTGLATAMTTTGPGALHGLATVAEVRLGWSYRLMDWYELPQGQSVQPPGAVVVCAT